MKTIKLNFGSWNRGAKGGRIRRIYERWYRKGWKWTPIIFITWKILPVKN